MQNTVRWRSNWFRYICQRSWRNNVKRQLMRFIGLVLVQKPSFDIRISKRGRDAGGRAAGRSFVYARRGLPKTILAEIFQLSSGLSLRSQFQPSSQLSLGERKTEIWNNLDHSRLFPERNGSQKRKFSKGRLILDLDFSAGLISKTRVED